MVTQQGKESIMLRKTQNDASFIGYELNLSQLRQLSICYEQDRNMHHASPSEQPMYHLLQSDVRCQREWFHPPKPNDCSLNHSTHLFMVGSIYFMAHGQSLDSVSVLTPRFRSALPTRTSSDYLFRVLVTSPHLSVVFKVLSMFRGWNLLEWMKGVPMPCIYWPQLLHFS